MFIYYFILIVAVVAATIFLVRAGGNLTIWAITLIFALLSPLPIYSIVMGIAKDQKQTYHEYWNGYETAAYTNVNVCEYDGDCSNTYDCDPYTEIYFESVKDADGEGSHQEMRTRTVYHDCPYSLEETDFIVDSTLDTYAVASNLMTGQAFRASNPIPGGQVTAPPAAWSAAKARVDAGKPGGVTKVSDYKNFILSSDNTVLKRYSEKIDELTADGLLPSPVSGVVDIYHANKAAFAGDVEGIDQNAINEDLTYLNGAVGSDLRGDVRMVFVDGDAAGSPEDYGNALMAHWQSPEFGRDAIAKNAIIIVVGVEAYKYVKPVAEETEADATASPTPSPTPAPAVDDTDARKYKNGTPVASWVRAYTGMPLGNESMLNQLQNDLTGIAIDDSFVGSPTMDIPSRNVVHTDGAVENILFGENAFVRVSMQADDADDEGSGFDYLASEWEPASGDWVLFYVISVVVFLMFAVGGFFAAFADASRYLPDPVGKLVSHLFSSSK